MYEKIKRWYALGLWTEDMVKNAVTKGAITQEQCNEIIGLSEEV